jgi:hypothetical protein
MPQGPKALKAIHPLGLTAICRIPTTEYRASYWLLTYLKGPMSVLAAN